MGQAWYQPLKREEWMRQALPLRARAPLGALVSRQGIILQNAYETGQATLGSQGMLPVKMESGFLKS